MLAFEPRRSDLPLQVAFPILLANLTGELLGSTTAPSEAVEPGTPVELAIPTGAIGVTVTAPDGSVTELVPGTTGGSAVSFAATDLIGVYTVTPIADPDASPAPSASAGTGSSPSPRASPSAAASPEHLRRDVGASPPPEDPMAPVQFAVDLFDVDEFDDRPGLRGRHRGARHHGCRLARDPGTGGRDDRAPDHARRAVGADRPAGADLPVRRVGALPP